MRPSAGGLAALLVVAGISTTAAAPNIPSSELPGRERYRFEPSPVERYMQPTQKSEPLIRWQCDNRKPRSSKQRKPKQWPPC